MQNFIPSLLDRFCSTLLTGKHGTENGEGKTLRKTSIVQDIIYSASNGRLLTPKSVLLPAVVKSLCNNTEVLRMLNKLGHGISYDSVQEIETEHALDVINVRWPTSVKAKLFSSRQNFLSQGKTLFPKAKLSFLRQNFPSQGKAFFLKTKLFSQGKTFFLKAKLSFSRQNFFVKAKLSFPRQNFLSQGKTFFPKSKLSFSRQNFLSQGGAFFLKTKLC